MLDEYQRELVKEIILEVDKITGHDPNGVTAEQLKDLNWAITRIGKVAQTLLNSEQPKEKQINWFGPDRF